MIVKNLKEGKKMGLDMYLFAVPKIDRMNFREILFADTNLTHLKKADQELYQRLKPHIITCNEPGQPYQSLVIELAYWRKANQIHNWFVKNVQNGQDNCMPYEVSKEHMQQLYNCCQEVLDKQNGYKILPTKYGFHFGSTEYDRFYYMDVEQTKNIAADILELYDFDSFHLIYNSSW
jgi:hypothetical protein